ncbi:MAG: DUF4328 domain-containing protein [Alphaproteobacteria bacterium]|nr:DUF4328 domain-containing protein [Alphaproteobacteria bacterium]
MAAASQDSASGASAPRDHVYVDPQRLGQLLRWALIALIVADVVLFVSTGLEYQLLARIRDRGAFPGMTEAAQANDARQGVVAIFQVLTFVVAGFLVLRWIWRSNKNLWASGVAMENTPGWAVGWYFVPFANLWKPYQAMREIWQQSLREEAHSNGPLPWWWAFWLATNIAGNLSFRLSLSQDVSLLVLSNIAGLVSAAADIGACIMLLRIVARVTGAQRNLPAVTETFS